MIFLKNLCRKGFAKADRPAILLLSHATHITLELDTKMVTQAQLLADVKAGKRKLTRLKKDRILSFGVSPNVGYWYLERAEPVFESTPSGEFVNVLGQTPLVITIDEYLFRADSYEISIKEEGHCDYLVVARENGLLMAFTFCIVDAD